MSYKSLPIIIVDDMQFSRAVANQVLKKAGYTDIRICESGLKVLEALQERHADVLLADWEMPGMSGLELTRIIRKRGSENSWYTSIVLFTAKEGERALLEAFSNGVDDYIQKPVGHIELLARVYSAGRIAQLQNNMLQQKLSMEALQTQMQPMISIDQLTGLYNRNRLKIQLDKTLRQVGTRGGSLCLGLVDLRGLEGINNKYSYEIGNEVLISLTGRLRRQFRPLDFIARYHNSCFAVLLYSENHALDFDNILFRVIFSLVKRPLTTTAGAISFRCSIGAQSYRNNTGQRKANIPSASEIEHSCQAQLEEAKIEDDATKRGSNS